MSDDPVDETPVVDGHSTRLMQPSYRRGQLLAVGCVVLGSVVTFWLWASHGSLSLLGVLASVPLLVGLGLALIVQAFAAAPIERFEMGERHDTATYRGISVETTLTIEPAPEAETIKRRVVRIVARDGDEVVAHRATKQDVGTLAWPLKGDFEGIPSSSAHVARVADTIKDDIDEYLAAEGRDPAIQAGLESGFDDGLRANTHEHHLVSGDETFHPDRKHERTRKQRNED